MYGKTSMGVIRSRVRDRRGCPHRAGAVQRQARGDGTRGALAALASSRSTVPTPPFDGVRVLDLSRILAGPYCSMMLAGTSAPTSSRSSVPGGRRPDAQPEKLTFVEGELRTSPRRIAASARSASTSRGPGGVGACSLPGRAGRHRGSSNFLPGAADRLSVDFDALRRSVVPRALLLLDRRLPGRCGPMQAGPASTSRSRARAASCRSRASPAATR